MALLARGSKASPQLHLGASVKSVPASLTRGVVVRSSSPQAVLAVSLGDSADALCQQHLAEPPASSADKQIHLEDLRSVEARGDSLSQLIAPLLGLSSCAANQSLKTTVVGVSQMAQRHSWLFVANVARPLGFLRLLISSSQFITLLTENTVLTLIPWVNGGHHELISA